MNRSVVLYRGSLKSCNYGCSYCPFSKHRMSERELEEDRRSWLRFVDSLVGERPRREYGALMVAPYGEALIHPWYPEGLGRVSSAEWMDAVGAQTNLSFSLRDFLERFCQSGGRLEKMRLWATFHPEMTGAEEFADRCRRAREAGISLCAGGVGVPENIGELKKLRKLLPEEIYLWVNKMDGLRRRYTETEKAELLEVDPWFWRELLPVAAEPGKCGNRVFVESDGRQRICNIGQVLGESWYGPDGEEKGESGPEQSCGRRQCSCYLAYGGREDWRNRIIFGAYPIFRIPRRLKAVFLDIDGTLISDRGGEIDESTLFMLQTLLQEKTMLFFATTLPCEDARRRCKKIWHLFDGGIFAGGAHVLLRGKGRQEEYFYRIREDYVSRLEALKKEYGFRVLAYGKGKGLYKLTLLRPAARPWSREEEERLRLSLEPEGEGEIRWIRESNCLQMVAAQAGKGAGVRMICRWLGISFQEAAAAGDSEEDRAMMDYDSR